MTIRITFDNRDTRDARGKFLQNPEIMTETIRENGDGIEVMIHSFQEYDSF